MNTSVLIGKVMCSVYSEQIPHEWEKHQNGRNRGKTLRISRNRKLKNPKKSKKLIDQNSTEKWEKSKLIKMIAKTDRNYKKSKKKGVRPKWKAPYKKNFEFQRFPPKSFWTGFLWTRLDNKKFQTFGKARKKQIWGRCWTKIGLRKTQANILFEATKFRVLTGIDR